MLTPNGNKNTEHQVYENFQKLKNSYRLQARMSHSCGP